MDWLTDLFDRFLPDVDDRARATRLAGTIALGGDVGATAYLEACRLLGEASEDGAGLIGALDEIVDPATLDHVGFLVIACFVTVRAEYPARPDAQRARAALAARADPVVEAAGAAFGHVLHGWLLGLVGEALRQVSQIAANRAPLVRVETGVSLPSTLLAWDLYGDPARDAELVERNQIGTAMVMPVILEAVAP